MANGFELGAPIFAQGQDVLGQRLAGQGIGTEAFGELGQALLRDLAASGARGARGIESRAAISGTGRTGATAAQQRGLQAELGRTRASTLGQLGVQEAGLREEQQGGALAQLLGLRGQLQNEQFERERLELMRQDLEQQGVFGIGDLIGAGVEALPVVGSAVRGVRSLFGGGGQQFSTSLPTPLPPLGGSGALLPNLFGS